MQQDQLRVIATQSALFSRLSDEETTLLLAASTLRQVQQGKLLFHQGDPPDLLFLVVSGMVRMSQINADGIQITLRIMKSGDVLGCVAVLKQFPYPATATVLNDTTVLSWRTPVFLELTNRHSTIADNVLSIVGDRARDMVQRIAEMTSKRIEQRIAVSLLRLSDQAGIKTDQGIHIEFPVTRADLAEMSGLTYFTISRTLSGWQKQGLLKSGRHRMTILDLGRLAEIADPHVT
jgi:CRP/FNR family transcriptional regulator, nitrogen oxide reductase regulator